MSMSVEQFLSLSDAEQLQTIKDLNDIGQEEIIIDVLTGVGIDNLSVPLLGELGRAYNNNDKPEEAIKVFKTIDSEHRDAVWHYRCAYSHGSIASTNHEAYTSENMQQMLALVDNGVQLATKEDRNDIKEYCFEVMDMCRLQMDFEKCEVDYPDLCLNYSKYIAEKKKKREGVPRQRTITVEEILATDDMWTINEPAYWTISIYGSYDNYLDSAQGFTVE